MARVSSKPKYGRGIRGRCEHVFMGAPISRTVMTEVGPFDACEKCARLLSTPDATLNERLSKVPHA